MLTVGRRHNFSQSLSIFFTKGFHFNVKGIYTRAANSIDFYIECKFEFEFSLFYEFEFNIFIFASSSSSLSPVKIYQVFSSSENKVIDLA